MCVPIQEAQKVFQKMGSTPPEQYFSSQFMADLRNSHLAPNHCLSCGGPLTYEEMNPLGRPQRYLHKNCYERMAYSDPHFCLWCGGPLPLHQVQKRINQPRELLLGFHEGPGGCKEMHLLGAGIVFGLPLPAMSANQFNSPNWGNNRMAQPHPIRVIQHDPYAGRYLDGDRSRADAAPSLPYNPNKRWY